MSGGPDLGSRLAKYGAFVMREAQVRAAESCQLLMFGTDELEKLQLMDPASFVALLILAVQSLAPLIRRFISLGLNRVWLSAGDQVRSEPPYRVWVKT